MRKAVAAGGSWANSPVPLRPAKKPPAFSLVRILGIAAALILTATASVVYVYWQALQPQVTTAFTLDDSSVESPPPAVLSDEGSFVGAARASHRLLLNSVRTDSPKALLRAAQLARSLNDPLSAYSFYSMAASLEPGAAALDGGGTCALDLGLLPEAKARFTALTKLEPRNPLGWIGLAKTLAAQSRPAESAAALDLGVRSIPIRDPAGRTAIIVEFERRGDFARAFSEAELLLTAQPGDRPLRLLEARLLMKLNRLAEARSRLEEMIVANGDDYAAKRLLGSVLCHPLNPAPDPRHAERLLLEVLEKRAGDQNTFRHLGQLYMNQGLWRKAAVVFVKLLRSAPDATFARFQLAKAYSHMEGPSFRRLAEEQKQTGNRCSVLDRREEALSLEVMRRPVDPAARLLLARFLAETGRCRRALPDYEAAWVLSQKQQQIRAEASRFCEQFGIALHDPRSPAPTAQQPSA